MDYWYLKTTSPMNLLFFQSLHVMAFGKITLERKNSSKQVNSGRYGSASRSFVIARAYSKNRGNSAQRFEKHGLPVKEVALQAQHLKYTGGIDRQMT